MRTKKKYYLTGDGSLFEAEITRQGKKVLYQTYPPEGSKEIDQDEYNERFYKAESNNPMLEGLPKKIVNEYLNDLKKGVKKNVSDKSETVQASESKKL